METTGILYREDIGGVRRMTTGAAMRMSSARTINVYGRFRASLTIHIWSLWRSLVLRLQPS